MIRQLLDSPLLLDRESRGDLDVFLDAKGDRADQIVPCQRVICTGVEEDGFDALSTLLNSNNWRSVVNLLRQPGGERIREEIISPPDFVVPIELLIERPVAKHEQGRDGFGPIIKSSRGHERDGLW